MGFSGLGDGIQNDDLKRKAADKRRFENDLLALKSDRSRFAKKIESADLEVRVLQKKYTTLGFDIKNKQIEMKKNKSKLDFLDEEIRVLKRKISTIV